MRKEKSHVRCEGGRPDVRTGQVFRVYPRWHSGLCVPDAQNRHRVNQKEVLFMENNEKKMLTTDSCLTLNV